MSKYLKKKYINLNGQEQLGEFIFTFSIDNFSTFALCGREGGGGVGEGQNPPFFFFKMVWNVQKNFSNLWGGCGRVGGFASYEDQIGRNILSIFNFSRGKNLSYLKGAETKKISIMRGGGWC